MISFNDVLREGDVDPAKVKMLRHTVKGKQVLEVWRADRALVRIAESRGPREARSCTRLHGRCASQYDNL